MKTLRYDLIALFVLLPCAALATGPLVKVSVYIDHPRATENVTGTGFSANEAVDIYWDTTDMLLGVTNGTGAFGPFKLQIPADALPGQHWVTAIGRKTGDAAQKPFTVSTNWASPGFSARGTRYNPYENVVSTANVSSLDVAWAARTGPTYYSTPAVAKGIVYLGSEDKNLYAFDAATGTPKWTAATGGAIYGSPAVANGIVYVGSADGKLYAFNAATGTQKCTGLTSNQIWASPTVANGTVYIGSEDQQLWTFKAGTCVKGWFAGTGGRILSTAAVANGAVYVGSDDDMLYAFDAASGSKLWSTAATGSYIDSSPAFANGFVAVGSDDDYLYAFGATSGFQQWNVSTGGGFGFKSPAAAKNTFYAATYFTLYATGQYSWSENFGDYVTSPSIANGVVYLGVGSGVDAVNAANGAILWKATGDNYYMSSGPAIADGMVYVATAGGHLYAFALNGGNNAAYRHTRTLPPSYASLHPDLRLMPTR